ncbi:MAG TPA: hypothetical protein DDW65_09530 [Firmicutes bacterium]|jgi:hypothetical protein|nr:hypothetical protein [Bacillota bacterium]
MSVSVKSKTPTPATGWSEQWKEAREHGSRRVFGDFFSGKKVTRPMESVDQNDRHIFSKYPNKKDFANVLKIFDGTTACSLKIYPGL